MQRKHLLLTSLVLLVSGLPAKAATTATTYTVKAGGGGNFTTIQACATAMAPGDTCTVFAGTYNEAVTVSAGTVGNYKTFNVNAGDTVNVLGFTLGSHTKAIGFNITNPSSPSSGACVAISSGSTDVFITKNVMTACGSGGTMISTPLSTTGVSFVYIQGNTMSYGCSTPGAPNTCEGMLLDGNHFLVENNDISHVSDGITLYASFSVIRNNTMHDTLTSECGSHSSNCHIDFMESEPNVSSGVTPASFDNLFEGNTILRNTGGNLNNHVFLTQGDACNGQCSHAIFRFNTAAHIGSTNGTGYGILDQLGGYTYVKAYNETQACVGGSPNFENTDTFGSNSTNGAELNNIFYYCNPSVTSLTVIAIDASSTPGFTAGSNLCFGSVGAFTCAGRILTDPGDKIGVDPLFVSPATDNYHLQGTSPAIGAGRNLTTASDSGSSSTSLAMADAAFFQDGLGLNASGVQADWVRIGASTTVQISSINYATNVVTLANPVSWNNGDPVYLYKNSRGTQVLFGANPDIGAFPSGSSQSQGPVPPTGLLAVVQ